MFAIQRSAALPAVSQIIGSITKPVVAGPILKGQDILIQQPDHAKKTSFGLSKLTLKSATKITQSFASKYINKFNYKLITIFFGQFCEIF
jgi:hypothetical protein